PAVYPAFEIYPRVERAGSLAKQELGPRLLEYPLVEIYPLLPAKESLSFKSQPVRAPSYYPTVNPYPSVYPFLELYPALPLDISKKVKSTGYRDFNLYSEHAQNFTMPITIDHVYPIFNLYLAVYPYFDLYPVVSGMVESKAAQPTIATIAVNCKVQPNYPAFTLALNRPPADRTGAKIPRKPAV
ncbi:hypothetical protein C0995_014489, partial [Termitomyces sp. Mi166